MKRVLRAIACAGAITLGATSVWAQAPLPNMPRRVPAARLLTQPGPGAVLIPRENCGTFWTEWGTDPEADSNPCPPACERGERQVLDSRKAGDQAQYHARYQCYLPELFVNQPADVLQLAAGAPARQNCGTFWTGAQSDLSTAANPCPANCDRGELQTVRRSFTSNGGARYEMRYQCYVADRTTQSTAARAGVDQSAPALRAVPQQSQDSPVATERPGRVPTLPPAPAGAPTLPTAPRGVTNAGEVTLQQDPRPAGPPLGTVRTTVLGPTSVRLDWDTPAETPQGYTLNRGAADGSNVERLPAGDATAASFVDNGLAPVTSYSYQLIADNGPGRQPSATGVVTVTTGLAPPPTDFAVSRRGDSAVHLSWTPRPEAIAYQVSRNGAVFPVTGASYEDTGLTRGDYTYTVRTIMRLPSGAETLGEVSEPLTIRLRPFVMVTAGDSVMWGQGLGTQQKFSTQVRGWLEGLLQKTVELQAFAHSGAGIAEGTSTEEAIVQPGEVPYDFPSIRQQLLRSAPGRVNPSDVDFVLVDGCINDVGVLYILGEALNPLSDTLGLKSQVRFACFVKMRQLLTEAADKYKNAKFVVTGYFPIVSEQTDPLEIVGLIWGLYSSASWIAGGVGGAPAIVGSAQVLGITAVLAKGRLAEFSKTFDEESEKQLREAIRMQGAVGAQRMRFAQIPYTSANAYGAPATWLWYLPIPLEVDGHSLPNRKDTVFDSRWQECVAAPKSDFKCYIGSIAHPNIAGASAYAAAVQSQLTPFVGEWAASHSSTMSAPKEPLYMRVDYGARTPSGGSLAVLLADSATGVPVGGTVAFDGQVAGAIGGPLAYTYRSADAGEIAVEVRPQGHPIRRFRIPPRALAVHVAHSAGYTTRTLTVTARDKETGAPLQGTVRVVDSSGRSVGGSTGQPIRYTACTVSVVEPGTDGNKPTQMIDDLGCGVTLNVPYYPTVQLTDEPGDF